MADYEEARRLLGSTTALLWSHNSMVGVGWRPMTVSPLSPLDSRRRRRVELPSARDVRVDPERLVALATRDNASLARSSTLSSPSSVFSSKHSTLSSSPGHGTHAMAGLVEVYEAQLEALLGIARRYRLAHGRRGRGPGGLGPLAGPARPRARSPPLIAPRSSPSLFAERSALAAAERSYLGSAGAAGGGGVEATTVVQRELDDLRGDAGSVLAELRISLLRMIQLLRAAQATLERERQRVAWLARAPSVRLAPARRGASEARHGADGTALLSRYELKYIEAPPAAAARARDSPTLWRGFNFVLRALSDFWRLPLPTATDPFGLRWFEELAGCEDYCSAVYAPARWHSAAELAELADADEWVRSALLGPARLRALDALELELGGGGGGGGVGRDWHAVAALLYDGTPAFIARKAGHEQRARAQARIAMRWRRWQLDARADARRDRVRRVAAVLLQRWWRRCTVALHNNSWMSEMSVLQRREWRVAQRESLQRAKLFARRRLALMSALAEYEVYLQAVGVVQSFERVRQAKRRADELRKRRLGFAQLLAARGARLLSGAIRWQRQVRRWEQASDLMWSEYRRVVGEVTDYSPGRAADEVLAAVGALKASLEAERDAVRLRLDDSPPSTALNYHLVLGALAGAMGACAVLQGLSDAFWTADADTPFGAYEHPASAVAGDNPPRAWLRAKAAELKLADEGAVQHALPSGRRAPYTKAVLQTLGDEAHARLCTRRALLAARELAATLVGQRDVLGERADPSAARAAAELRACLTEPVSLAREEALAAAPWDAPDPAARRLRAERAGGGRRFKKGGPARWLAFDKEALLSEARVRATDAPGEQQPDAPQPDVPPAARGVLDGFAWASQLLVGVYGQLAATAGALEEEDGAELLPMRLARARCVTHESRLGSLETLRELVLEFGLRERFTPKIIMTRAREERESKLAEVEGLRAQLGPATEALLELRALQAAQATLDGQLRLLVAAEAALRRERWQTLTRARVSLGGQLAHTARVKPAYKAAAAQLGRVAGMRHLVRELRGKVPAVRAHLNVRVDASTDVADGLTAAALEGACREALAADVAACVGCDVAQLEACAEPFPYDEAAEAVALASAAATRERRMSSSTMTGSSARRGSTGAARAGVSVVLGYVVRESLSAGADHDELRRVRSPSEVVEALRELTRPRRSQLELVHLARALGPDVRDEELRLSVASAQLPDPQQLTVMRALQEARESLHADGERAAAALAAALREKGRRRDSARGSTHRRAPPAAPVPHEPLGPFKRAADEVAGRDAALLRLEAACPERGAARAARAWLPGALDRLEAEAAALEAEAERVRDTLGPLYAGRKPVKAELRATVQSLRALQATLPSAVLEGLAVRVPQPRAQEGWTARDSYLEEKRLVLLVAREAAALEARLGAAAAAAAIAAAAAGAPPPPPPPPPRSAGAWTSIMACVQMRPRPSTLRADARLTPAAVRAMAVRLGVSLVREHRELYLLNAAVEALIAPLPVGWVEEAAPDGWHATQADAAAAAGAEAPLASPYRFRHELSGELRAEHPLLPAFCAHVARDRRRRGKPRKWSHLEGWMQFAREDGQLVYVDLTDPADEQGCETLPQVEAPSVKHQRSAVARGRALSRFGRSADQRAPGHLRVDVLYDAIGQEVERERVALRARCEADGRVQAAAKLAPLYRAVRAGAVRMRPCALPLIYIAASSLELEVSAVPGMAWLAEMIISCPPTFQPAGWYEWSDENPLTGVVSSYYANAVCDMPKQRAEHPYRVEVVAVQQVVRELQKQFLAADTAYLESFELNAVLENVRRRQRRTRQPSTLDLSTVAEVDRELALLHSPKRKVLRLNQNSSFVKRPAAPPAAAAPPPPKSSGSFAKRGGASGGAPKPSGSQPAATKPSRQMLDQPLRSTSGARPTIVRQGRASEPS